MRMRIYKFVCILLMMLICINIFASDCILAYREIFFESLNSTGEIKDTVIAKIPNGFSISLNTEGLEEGYYTQFFTPDKDVKLEGINAASLKIKNNSKEDIRINFVGMNEAIEYRAEDENIIFSEEEGLDGLEEIKMQYGTFNIAGNKSITLYIPFKSLKMEGINHLNNYGFSVTCEALKNINFEISDFSLLSNEEGMIYNNMLSYDVHGDDVVEIPTCGESISSYKEEGNDNKVYFSIVEEKDGVYIDGDGVLHVKNTADPGNLNIKVESLDGSVIYKSVQLKNSWTRQEESNGNDRFAIPQRVDERESTFTKLLLNKNIINAIEGFGVLCSVLALIIFINWKGYIKVNIKLITIFTVISLIFIGTIIFNEAHKLKVQEIPVIKRTMNIGNALEAPKDIKWDLSINEEYIDKIKEGGFDTVRLPVRFSDYADEENSYKLDEKFMAKVDYYINYILQCNLNVILDMHHFEEIMEDPLANEEKFLSMWKELSLRYKDYPNKLFYEVLNEPKDNLSEDIWNGFLKKAVKTIRKNDKDKYIIFGGADYNSYESLLKLKIPRGNKFILTFHYYDPNDFTFQGEQYHEGFEDLHDIEWNETEEETNEVKTTFKDVKDFAKKNKLPIFLGEFGANKEAPRNSRILWTKFIRETAEEDGFSWAYWEMASSFGVYDKKTHTYDEEMLNALIEK